jgi:hypothetical protein
VAFVCGDGDRDFDVTGDYYEKESSWTGSIMDRRARCSAAWDSSGPCLHLRCSEHSALNL